MIDEAVESLSNCPTHQTMSECCKEGFAWNGTPEGKESKIAGLSTYIASQNKKTEKAILMIHDVFGWTFKNTQLLADHYSKGTGADVYLVDFFGGEIIIDDLTNEEKKKNFDLMAFLGRNSKEKRFPEVKRVVAELQKEYKNIGAIGFCYGGWAVAQLAAKENQPGVNYIAAAHPSLLTEDEIKGITVPVLWLAPEHDPQFTPELKELAQSELKSKPGKYIYFPNLAHGFAGRGDPNNTTQKEGLERAMHEFIAFAQS